MAVENYMVEKKLHELEHPPETPDMPSAPVEEACSVSALPSVKSVNEVECVVCMDSEVYYQFIYLFKSLEWPKSETNKQQNKR